MTAKPDFVAVEELQHLYSPWCPGIVTNHESDLIRDTLELDKRSGVELRNIRNAVVTVYIKRMEEVGGYAACNMSHAMHVICNIIDAEMLSRGLQI